jgi:hypothetical protein
MEAPRPLIPASAGRIPTLRTPCAPRSLRRSARKSRPRSCAARSATARASLRDCPSGSHAPSVVDDPQFEPIGGDLSGYGDGALLAIDVRVNHRVGRGLSNREADRFAEPVVRTVGPREVHGGPPERCQGSRLSRKRPTPMWHGASWLQRLLRIIAERRLSCWGPSMAPPRCYEARTRASRSRMRPSPGLHRGFPNLRRRRAPSRVAACRPRPAQGAVSSGACVAARRGRGPVLRGDRVLARPLGRPRALGLPRRRFSRSLSSRVVAPPRIFRTSDGSPVVLRHALPHALRAGLPLRVSALAADLSYLPRRRGQSMRESPTR